MAVPSRSPATLGALIAAAFTLYAAASRSSSNQQGSAERAKPSPAPPPAPSVLQRLRYVWDEMNRDHISVMAAGVAFYTLLSIFPGMSAAISLFGLVSDPVEIERHLQSLAGVVPGEALKLISDQVHALVAAPSGKLGLGLIVSLALALWSATSGTTTLMQALTVAYEENDGRGLLHFYGLAIGLTLAMIVFGVLALLLVAGVPAVLNYLPWPDSWREGVSFIRWPVLAGLVLLALGFVYRAAPSRKHSRWEWLSPGTIAATLVWLLGSAGFSFYVARFGSYDRTYGSIGAVVVLLMWFYVTAYIILAGAELNAEFGKSGPSQRDKRDKY